jgi:hypothetical protein
MYGKDDIETLNNKRTKFRWPAYVVKPTWKPYEMGMRVSEDVKFRMWYMKEEERDGEDEREEEGGGGRLRERERDWEEERERVKRGWMMRGRRRER